jgi:RNA polymerase sigma-54 factor
MKQTLQLRVSQQLTLTPQLQQSIRLLQLSTVELNQELERFLAENPMLEADEPAPEQPQAVPGMSGASPAEHAPAAESAAPQDEHPAASSIDSEGSPTNSVDVEIFDGGNAGSRDEDDGDEPQVAAEGPSLRSHLLEQVAEMKISQRDRALVEILIDCLDDDGYFRQDMDEVAAMLPESLDIDPQELSVALRRLQGFDPIGVGARSLSECLELQLLAIPEPSRARELALAIVRDHLQALGARDFTRLKRQLQCDETVLRQAHRLIQDLNPRPANAFARVDLRYVVPDVVVKKVRNVWVASLNPDAIPKLRINRMYAEILQGHRNGSGGQLSQQLQEARWLIKNVQQRFETIQRVAQAIVDRQRHFFDHGEVAMRPLVLREIAELLGLHESTVSRVTTQKFMATPRGVFELKYFFGSHVSTDTGGACSATAIRALIRQLVAAEDDKKPLSDSRISEILGEQGIVVARRTIAKYRESLQIPPVNLRKSL